MLKIDLKNITKEYQKDLRAVESVTISAEPGDFLVLVGPSGCGKSTILRMIAGLEDITSGDLYFNDKRMNDINPGDRNIGMVFQNYALYPHLTVYDNLAFPLKIKKHHKTEIDARVKEIAGLTGLSDYLTRKPKQLSGGQRQRVALGRALVRKPDIFLFDEPLSNLDSKLRVQMRNEIISLHGKAETTSVYVTHDQVEAMTMGTRIAVLDAGKLQQFGTPDEIYLKPANLFVAGFLGSPQMNFFNGKIDSEAFINDNFKLNFDNEVHSSKVTLGIRPEHIEINNDSYDFSAKVLRTEFLGHEQLVYAEVGSETFCIRTGFNRNYSKDEIIRISFLRDKLHLFDNLGLRI